MQITIRKIILKLVQKNQKIGITNIQTHINTSADIIEQYISELIAEHYLTYDANEDLLSLTEIGFSEINNVRTLCTTMPSIGLLPYEGSYNVNGYPILETPNDLAEHLKCKVYYKWEYHNFTLTVNNKTRIISAPPLDLKQRQRWILDNILSHFKPLDSVHGFVPGKSIKTNALCHINKQHIACLDISSFFPSITFSMVKNAFMKMGYSYKVAAFLTRLTTYEGVLPQGAPTSPMLANIVFHEVDIKILAYTKENNLTYTRYADDITISGDSELNHHLDEIRSIIRNFGFIINENKTHFMNGNNPKTVTGLIVSDKVRVPSKYKNKLRQEIYFCNKFGVANHLRNVASRSSNNKKHYDGFQVMNINYREHLYGKAYYIKMVEPDVGEYYLKQLDEIFCN